MIIIINLTFSIYYHDSSDRGSWHILAFTRINIHILIHIHIETYVTLMPLCLVLYLPYFTFKRAPERAGEKGEHLLSIKASDRER